MFYLICYDSPSNKRRRRMHKTLKDFAIHVQESVFETFLEAAQFERLVKKLEKVIDPDADSVRIYGMSGKAQRAMKVYGLPGRLEDRDHHVVPGGCEAAFRPMPLDEDADDLPDWL